MHMNPMNLSFGDKSTKHLTPHGKHHRSFVEKQKKKETKKKRKHQFHYISNFGGVNLNIKKKKNIKNLVQNNTLL